MPRLSARALAFLLIGISTVTSAVQPSAAQPQPAQPSAAQPSPAQPSADSPAQLLDWSQLPALPDATGLAGPFAGVSGDALIVAGGANFPGGRPWNGAAKVWHDRVYVLTQPDGQWRTLDQTLPRPLAYGVALSTRQGVVCLGGGDAGQHYTDAFVIRWTGQRITIDPLPPMPGPSALLSGALLDDVVYVAGGLPSPDATATLHTFWSLDLSAPADQRHWQSLAPWPGRPRMLAVAAAQDGAFFLFSGADLEPDADAAGKPRRRYLRDAYRYRPAEGWRRIADLPRPAVAAPSPAPTVGDAHVLVIGGDDGQFAFRVDELRDNHPGFGASILAYHTVTDTWRPLGRFPKDVGPDPVADPGAGLWPAVTTAAVRWGDRIVIPTGEVRPGVRSPRVPAARIIEAKAHFHALDYAAVAVYLAVLVAMGGYISRREHSTDDFFLGGRRVPWWAAGLSIFGTQLSAITFMAIPALVYRTDWVYFLGNMAIVAIAPVVVWLYLPFYRRLNVTTAYEYLERRFHVSVRMLGSAAFILFQLGRMGIVLYLPALALATVTGFNIYVSIALMGVLATAYTVMGGIEAVIWTDVLQVAVLLGGALLSLAIIVAGLDGGAGEAFNLAASYGKFHAFTWSWDFTTTAVWVMFFGRLIEQLVPYTADQAVVQRYLTTADERKAAAAIWTNAALTIPSTLLFFAVGTALWAFYRTHPQLLNPAGRSGDVFPWFIAQQLPVGVSGLVIAGLFAASMSSLDSSMNSMATALVSDFFRRFNPHAGDRQCLNLARLLTLAMGALGTGAATIMAVIRSASMLEQYIQIVGLFGGGLAGLFVLGIFTRRANAPGGIVGFFASAAVLFLVKSNTSIHLLLLAAIGITTCVTVGWLASLATAAPSDLQGLTVHTMPARTRT